MTNPLQKALDAGKRIADMFTASEKTWFLMFRSSRGYLKPVTMSGHMMQATFSPDETARLLRGLPVERDGGQWADMAAITAQMFAHWDETP